MAGQHPVAKERQRVKDREVSETEKRGQRVKPLPYRLNLFFLLVLFEAPRNTFPPLSVTGKKTNPIPSLGIGRCLLVGS